MTPENSHLSEKRKAKRTSADTVERQIEQHFRQQIFSGKLPAGSRLPSNLELARQWSTSCTSVQRALATLAAEGLLERATSRGTFVRGKHERAFIAVLTGPNMVDGHLWYYRALWDALHSRIDSPYLSCRLYDGLGRLERKERIDSQLKQLQVDRQFHRFIGSIEILTHQVTVQIPLGDLPKAVVDPALPNNDVLYDNDHCGKTIATRMMELGTHHFWSIYCDPGRKTPSNSELRANCVVQHAQALGLKTFQHIGIPVNPSGRNIEEEVHSFMMDYLAQRKRARLPQSIVITDDIAARSVITALLKHGIKIPQDLEIFIVTAESANIFYSVPVNLYAFPIGQVADVLIERLQHRIAGRPTEAEPVVLPGIPLWS